jgi:ATP-binding cassette, subfamily C, bacterial
LTIEIVRSSYPEIVEPIQSKAAINRLNKIYQLEKEPVIPCNIDPFENQPTVSITLKNICFKYQQNNNDLDNNNPTELESSQTNESPYILNDLSLCIKPGEKVALVGSSGGGKSTLIHVLLGLYPTESGQILLNDIPIEQIGFTKIRENTAAVLQHPVLFNDSVRENLSLGKHIDDKTLWQALKTAQLETTIKELPEQLNTLIGRQGIRLSGGQRQRLAIARMILTEPKLVILDESTSALDTETEHNLHQSLKHYLKGKTTLIIAHRLSAVRQADRIVVIDNGQIIAQGSHQDLVNSNELYFRLYGMQ